MLRNLALFLTVCLALGAGTARADFFQNNLSNFETASLIMSDRYFDDDQGLNYGQETAERFNNVTVNSATQTLKVTWWGAANDPAVPGSSFGIRFYMPDGNQPAGGAFLATSVTPTATNLGTVITQGDGIERTFFRYEATLAFSPDLIGANDYWIAIYERDNQSDPGTFNDPSQKGWVWTSAQDILPGKEAFRDFALGNNGSWIQPPHDFLGRALTLETVSLTAVPEPSSLALLGAIGAGFGYRRRRRYKVAATEN